MLSISYSAVSGKKSKGSAEHMISLVRKTGGSGMVNSGKVTSIGPVSKDQLIKLNELAKHRPFNILYKVKRYDPL
ncbi:MAG TPA: hypothetical protein VMH27_19825 [Puia sp.]|nr:hypothetical protein [Puia sp.]